MFAQNYDYLLTIIIDNSIVKLKSNRYVKIHDRSSPN